MKKILDFMMDDMKNADIMFKPTNFWEIGLGLILKDLKEDKDFENFRRHTSAKKMYVCNYEHSLYKSRKKLINKIFKVNNYIPIPDIEGIFGTFSGYNRAKCDYRVFCATNKNTYPPIFNADESLVGNPDEYFVFDNKKYSRSFLNYLLGINFLKNNADTSNIKNILEIGGGYGTLGEILIKSTSDIFYVNVDIPPVASVSTYYLTKIFGNDAVLSYDKSRDMDSIDIEELKKKYKAIVLCPWQLPKIKGQFDLFVNFMSFQEMEPHIVANYVTYIEKLTTGYVLLRNSQSGKNIVNDKNAIGVLEPTTMNAMYSMFKNFKLIQTDYKIYGQYYSNFISEIALLAKSS